MAMKTPDQVAAKWQQNLTNSIPNIKQGVQNVTQSPTAAAAAQASAYSQGVQNAVNSGKWQAGLQRVSLQSWQQATINKGLARIADGAQAGKSKVQGVMQQLLPFVQSAVASLPPRGGKAANQQRMIQFSEAMSNFQRQG